MLLTARLSSFIARYARKLKAGEKGNQILDWWERGVRESLDRAAKKGHDLGSMLKRELVSSPGKIQQLAQALLCNIQVELAARTRNLVWGVGERWSRVRGVGAGKAECHCGSEESRGGGADLG